MFAPLDFIAKLVALATNAGILRLTADVTGPHVIQLCWAVSMGLGSRSAWHVRRIKAVNWLKLNPSGFCHDLRDNLAL